MSTAFTEQRYGSADGVDVELVERAKALVPLLRENAAETEKNRVVHPENIDALRKAGLLSIATPRRYDGGEHNLRTFIEAVFHIGRGCGSTGWVASLHNGNSFMAALFTDECQEDYWGVNPLTQFCGVFSSNPTVISKKVDGGWQVSGSWGFASGCLHADWALISLPLVDEKDEVYDQAIAMMPISDFAIQDTWYVAGMRGTGSNTLVTEGMFVPEYRVTSLVGAIEGVHHNNHSDEVLYRSAFIPYASLILVAPMLGMVAAGIEYIDELLAKDKPIVYTFFPSARQAPVVQHSRAKAQVAFDDAWLHVRRIATRVDEAAASGEYPGLPERTRIKMEIGYTLRQLRTSVHHLLDIGGASSFAESCVLQRIWRDIEVSTRHGVMNPQISEEAYGRVLTGVLEPITPVV